MDVLWRRVRHTHHATQGRYPPPTAERIRTFMKIILKQQSLLQKGVFVQNQSMRKILPQAYI